MINLTSPNPLKQLELGPFCDSDLLVTHSTRPRVTNPVIENEIRVAWRKLERETALNQGVLFNNHIYCLQEYSIHDGQLALTISSTTYRELIGTNMTNPSFADRFGKNSLSNALGVFGTVITSDSKLVLGRRGGRYSFMAGRLHLPGGSIECDTFPILSGKALYEAYHCELREELGLDYEQIDQSICIGLFENVVARSPHLHFATLARLSSSELLDQHHLYGDKEFSDLVAVDIVGTFIPALLKESSEVITYAAKGALLYLHQHLSILKGQK